MFVAIVVVIIVVFKNFVFLRFATNFLGFECILHLLPQHTTITTRHHYVCNSKMHRVALITFIAAPTSHRAIGKQYN